MILRNILVTGSSGMIGTRLCDRLLDNPEYEVCGVDRKPNKWSDRVQHITVIGDLLDPEAYQKLGNDFDIVIHLAANARVYDLVVDPDQARDNINTTYNVLAFCRQNEINRILFASSREVYGNINKIPCNEDEVRMQNCESPYAASKLAGEALVRSFHHCYGMDFITMRFSNVYGMYDDSNRVIPVFIRRVIADQSLVVYGDNKLLDFTYIDDAVDGIQLALERFDQVKNDTYNLSYGQGKSILELAELIQGQLGKHTKISLERSRIGEVTRFVADIGKASKRLGFSPRVAFDEGVKKTVQWYTQHLYK